LVSRIRTIISTSLGEAIMQINGTRRVLALLALLLAGAVHAQQTDLPVLSIAVDRGVATEGSRLPVRIELLLDRPAPAGGTCIDLDLVGGTATQGVDFRLREMIPPIPPGGRMAMVLIDVLDDNQDEPDETLRIALRPSPCYQLGTPREFSLLIRDDDEDPATLQQRLAQIVANTPDPLIASQLVSLGELCATNRPPPGSELDRRCQLLRLALQNPAVIRQLIDSLRGVLGEELSSQRRGFRMLAGGQLGAIGRRLQAVRGGGARGVALVDSGIQSGLGFLPLEAILAQEGELLGRGIGVFASAVFGDGSREDSALESGYASDSRSFLLGIDRRFGSDWVLGAALGRTSFDADLSNAAGELGLDQSTLTVYASRGLAAGWIDGSLGVGRGEVAQTRVARFEAITEDESLSTQDVLRGDPDSRLLTASLGAGWDWQRGGLSFGPRAQLEYARFQIDAFAEQATAGSDAFAVALDQQVLRSLLARLGFGAQWAISTRHGVLLPQLDAHLVGEFEDSAEALRGRFLNSPQGASFTLPTADVDSRYAEASVSLAMQFTRGHSAFLSYRKVFGLEATEQDYLSLGLRLEF